MVKITCDPAMDAEIVKFLRGLDETQYAAICLYAAQRIEDLEAESAELRTRFMAADKSCSEDRGRIEELKSEVKAGAHLCADRQNRINDLEDLLSLAYNTLVHIKCYNDATPREAIVVGLMKTWPKVWMPARLLDETVLRLERFFDGKEGDDGEEKLERTAELGR